MLWRACVDKPAAIIFIYYGVVKFCIAHEVSYHIPMRRVRLTGEQGASARPQQSPPATMGRSISDVRGQARLQSVGKAHRLWVPVGACRPAKGGSKGVCHGQGDSLKAEAKLKEAKCLFLRLLRMGAHHEAQTRLNRQWPVNLVNVFLDQFFLFGNTWTAKDRGGDSG